MFFLLDFPILFYTIDIMKKESSRFKPSSKYFDNFKDLPFTFNSLKNKKKVIFDLINVEYISSKEINILGKLHKELKKNKVIMEIINCNANTYRILTKFGLTNNEFLKIKEKEI